MKSTSAKLDKLRSFAGNVILPSLDPGGRESIYLIRQKNENLWRFPTTKVFTGERVEDAAARGPQSEMGVDVLPIERIAVRVDGDRQTTYFLTIENGQDPQQTEFAEFKLVSWGEANDLLMECDNRKDSRILKKAFIYLKSLMRPDWKP